MITPGTSCCARLDIEVTAARCLEACVARLRKGQVRRGAAHGYARAHATMRRGWEDAYAYA